jgi:hypothetical protein
VCLSVYLSVWCLSYQAHGQFLHKHMVSYLPVFRAMQKALLRHVDYLGPVCERNLFALQFLCRKFDAAASAAAAAAGAVSLAGQPVVPRPTIAFATKKNKSGKHGVSAGDDDNDDHDDDDDDDDGDDDDDAPVQQDRGALVIGAGDLGAGDGGDESFGGEAEDTTRGVAFFTGGLEPASAGGGGGGDGGGAKGGRIVAVPGRKQGDKKNQNQNQSNSNSKGNSNSKSNSKSTKSATKATAASAAAADGGADDHDEEGVDQLMAAFGDGWAVPTA